MRILKTATMSLLMITAATTAFAAGDTDKMLGTLSVKATPVFAEGKLNACSIEYTAFIRDYKYKQGEVVHMSGSLGFQADGNARTFTSYLKIVLNDWDPKKLEFVPGDPGSALILNGNKTTKDALILSTVSDTPGGYFSVFDFNKTYENLSEAVEKNELNISYSRKGGKSDVPISIDLTVSETDDEGVRKKSDSNSLEFFQCTIDLIDVAKKDSSEKAKSDSKLK